MEKVSTYNSYEAARSKALKKIKDAAKDSGNELLEDVAEERDPRKQQARESNCHAVRMLVDKCLDSYREGDYTFKEAMSSLCGALQKIK